MRWAGSSARTNFTGKATYRPLRVMLFASECSTGGFEPARKKMEFSCQYCAGIWCYLPLLWQTHREMRNRPSYI